jgi:hypothetical protein
LTANLKLRYSLSGDEPQDKPSGFFVGQSKAMTLNITDPEVIARLTNQAIPIDARQPIQVSSI